ncbi:Ig-like domain-containing protein [Cellulomonas sp. PhB143]|uniref:Ig-like domain-containing protein n=1 Tax=Cellulomonas sp. PhB143 TaxID=2485186 RepID=UPI000F46EE91|nr:Ig-like domain-containing protein [Cellulomonas sp. PhB143]ROS76723.1 fibronectin type III domain protein [Cellulomonas sp. PhB143]
MVSLHRLRNRGRTVASVTTVAVFSGVLVTLAVTSQGEATADVDLNDSGVWVTRSSDGELGRFNTASQAMDGTLLAPSPQFDVLQQANEVVMAASGTGGASQVDVARLSLGPAAKLPAGAQVAMRDHTLAVLDDESHRLWVMPLAALAGFDPTKGHPTTRLEGDGGAITVDASGTVHAVDPKAGESVTITTNDGRPDDPERDALDVSAGDEVAATSVGDDVVVLDRTSSTLLLPGGDGVPVDDAASARLQQPGAGSDVVLVATQNALVTQPLDGGDATVRPASGRPAAPVHLGDCVYGAWAQTGQVVRDCPGTDADVERTIEGLDPQGDLEYRVNRDAIVLNDLASGKLWLPADKFKIVDDWDQKTPEQTEEGDQKDAEDSTPEVVDQFQLNRDQKNRAPRPTNDSFGVRPGRTTLLPVLANDVDPDGDVMTAAVGGEQPATGRVERVLDGAALQVVVPDDARGSSSFEYVVSDGRGGKATASVKLKVSPDGENGPPEQTGKPVLTVSRGGTGDIDVLPFFKDPDGDDLYLAGAAATTDGDQVTATPDGKVEFRATGGSTGRHGVKLSVADGVGPVVEGTLWVDVTGDTNNAPIAVADHVVVAKGEPVTVKPLRNDRDPDGDALRLANVSEALPAQVTPAPDAGTFRFVADEARSYDVTYQVTDGPATTTGLVRVDVVDPDDQDAEPVVVSDRALLPAGGSTLVDVLANDSDPAGGVLVVQSVSVPDDAGVTVAVLAHQVLRVTETRRLDEPVKIGYVASNGSQTANGQVSVIPVPEPSALRPPDAAEDEVTVHTGDVVTIPVLKNDTHPDALRLELEPELAEGVDPVYGDAFVSGDVVRFRAGAKAGDVYPVYKVRDPNGQEDSAQITIHIRDEKKNQAPQPADVQARVLAGDVVPVDLKLDGADPDGDSVALTGLGSAPSQGIARIKDGRIEYEASKDAAGTDSFTYTVADSRGATATATVRVGIAQPPRTNQPPVAVDDLVTLRPGRTVSIPATRNDTDPDGDLPALVPGTLEGGEALHAKVVGGRVVVTTPEEEGTTSFYYSVEDTFGARASAAITVTTSTKAPLERPVAKDDVVAVEDTLGKTSVKVPVLDNDEDPDGTATELKVTTGDAAVKASAKGVLDVPLTTHRQVITYTVTDVDGLTGQAFVTVPAVLSADEDAAVKDRQPPVLRPGVPKPQVAAGEDLKIDLSRYVVAAEGRSVRLTSEKKVKGLGGSVTVDGPTTLTYHAAEGTPGLGAVSFEVTDGTSADDPDGAVAALTLPVTVLPAKNLPPTPGSPTVEAAAGDESSVDLARFADDPDGDGLTFRITGAAPKGVSLTLEGSRVHVQATPETPKGSSGEVAYTVSDGKNPPVDGSLGVTVVASTRQLAVANDDVVAEAHQGEKTVVPVLANDANPFPDKDLEIVTASTETGSGGAVVDGDKVAVTPDADFVGVMVVRYQVKDATGDPDRFVDGRVRLTVQGRPATPATPQVLEVRSRTVVLQWTPPNNNGADITGYTVRSSLGDTFDCETTTCTLDGLTNDKEYTFTVVATNAVGDSEASPASAVARPDQKPDTPSAPTLTFGDKQVTVEWQNAAYADRSPITSVNLQISPAPPSGAAQKTGVTGEKIVWSGLANGTAYTVRVQAVNRAPDPSEWSAASASQTPAGPPGKATGVAAARVDSAVDGGVVDVTWAGAPANGDAVKQYTVTSAGGSAKSVTVDGSTHTARFTGLAVDKKYTFTVVAQNKAGKGAASGASNAVTPFGKPGKPGTPTARLSDGVRDVAVSWGAAKANGNAVTYTVKASNGTTKTTTGTSATFGNMPLGKSLTFTVTAANQAGSASSGTSKAIATKDVPSAPTGLKASGSGTTRTFSWGAPSDKGGLSIDKYEWSGSAGNGSGDRKSVESPSKYSTTFSLKVRAHNAAGWSGWTSTVSASQTPGEPSAHVVHGSLAQGYSDSYHFRVEYRNWPEGDYSFVCQDKHGSSWTDVGGGYQNPFHIGGDGTTGDLMCWYGFKGNPVRVLVNGKVDSRVQEVPW